MAVIVTIITLRKQIAAVLLPHFREKTKAQRVTSQDYTQICSISGTMILSAELEFGCMNCFGDGKALEI